MTELRSSPSAVSTPTTGQREYTTPAIEDLGSIADLTQGPCIGSNTDLVHRYQNPSSCTL